MTIERFEILGTPVNCVDMDRAVALSDHLITHSQEANSILAVNPEKIITAQKNPLIASALHSAALCIPDGIGVVVAARMLGIRHISRVPGSELMPRLCELAAAKGYGIYLFGANESVNQRAAAALLAQYPGLNIAGRDNGYLPESEYPALIERINRSGAKILFVALGSPRQERWIETHRQQLTQVRICQGVGGTMDVIAGEVKRTPLFFRRLSLEWAYRLITQPSRIGRQKALPLFVIRFLYSLLARPRN